MAWASLAVQEYILAADLQPDDATVALKAGGRLLLAGRFDDAKLWAEKVLAKDPTHLHACWHPSEARGRLLSNGQAWRTE